MRARLHTYAFAFYVAAMALVFAGDVTASIDTTPVRARHAFVRTARADTD